MPSSPHIISLLTDFGTSDGFVGIMKGVILGLAPTVQIVDLSHDIPPQDILAGALVLRNAVSYFPPGTIHVAVVDPGVGGPRRALLLQTPNAYFIGPDNGILSLAAPAAAIVQIVHLTETAYFLPHVSHTFHGRDIFAPVAGYLARGVSPDMFGTPVSTMDRLTLPAIKQEEEKITGSVISIDHFGNLTTNITAPNLLPFPRDRLSVSIGSIQIRGLASTYAAVPIGNAVAIINSWGMLEVAVRNGSAAQQLNVQLHSPVTVTQE